MSSFNCQLLKLSAVGLHLSGPHCIPSLPPAFRTISPPPASSTICLPLPHRIFASPDSNSDYGGDGLYRWRQRRGGGRGRARLRRRSRTSVASAATVADERGGDGGGCGRARRRRRRRRTRMRAAVAEVAVEGGGGPRTRTVPLQIPSLKKQVEQVGTSATLPFPSIWRSKPVNPIYSPSKRLSIHPLAR